MKIEKLLKTKFQKKKILKPNQITVVLPQTPEQAHFKSTDFQKEYNKQKDNLFFH